MAAALSSSLTFPTFCSDCAAFAEQRLHCCVTELQISGPAGALIHTKLHGKHKHRKYTNTQFKYISLTRVRSAHGLFCFPSPFYANSTLFRRQGKGRMEEDRPSSGGGGGKTGEVVRRMRERR